MVRGAIPCSLLAKTHSTFHSSPLSSLELLLLPKERTLKEAEKQAQSNAAALPGYQENTQSVSWGFASNMVGATNPGWG
jgi:hypothetical protein